MIIVFVTVIDVPVIVKDVDAVDAEAPITMLVSAMVVSKENGLALKKAMRLVAAKDATTNVGTDEKIGVIEIVDCVIKL